MSANLPERDAAETLPTRDTLERRLDCIRERLFDVQGTCGIAQQLARHTSGTETEEERVLLDIWTALRGAYRQIEAIAGELDPTTILDPQETENERIERELTDSRESVS